MIDISKMVMAAQLHWEIVFDSTPTKEMGILFLDTKLFLEEAENNAATIFDKGALLVRWNERASCTVLLPLQGDHHGPMMMMMIQSHHLF